MSEGDQPKDQDGPAAETRESRPSANGLFLRAFLSAIVAVGVLVLGALAYGVGAYRAAGPADEPTIVELKRGTGVAGIAEKLSQEGVITNPLLFQVAVKVRGLTASLKAGRYAIPEAASLAEVIDILEKGDTIAYRLTIPEGLTSYEIVQLLRDDDRLSGEITEIPAEGTLLPETYFVDAEGDRQMLLDRMREEQQAVIDELWPERDPDLPFETVEEAITLASIVEKETGVAGERALVAGVFVNRLNQGIKLQSDPTIIYGIKLGEGGLGRRIRRSEINTATDYNTYHIDGLPPGPICNPGREAIAAALHPVETDYLFFVADGSGGHAFAETYQEHLENAARWRALRDAPASSSSSGETAP